MQTLTVHWLSEVMMNGYNSSWSVHCTSVGCTISSMLPNITVFEPPRYWTQLGFVGAQFFGITFTTLRSFTAKSGNVSVSIVVSTKSPGDFGRPTYLVAPVIESVNLAITSKSPVLDSPA